MDIRRTESSWTDHPVCAELAVRIWPNLKLIRHCARCRRRVQAGVLELAFCMATRGSTYASKVMDCGEASGKKMRAWYSFPARSSRVTRTPLFGISSSRSGPLHPPRDNYLSFCAKGARLSACPGSKRMRAGLRGGRRLPGLRCPARLRQRPRFPRHPTPALILL